MNVVFHALAGGAIGHALFCVAKSKQPSAFSLGMAALSGIAIHGVLDWLRHGYPVPSKIDVVVALAISGAWLLVVRKHLRALFAVALASSFLPDVVDHLPRLLASKLMFGATFAEQLFPWHTPRWSGSLYPAAWIPPGSHLVALESGSNRQASMVNHALVVLAALFITFLGRGAFATRAT